MPGGDAAPCYHRVSPDHSHGSRRCHETAMTQPIRARAARWPAAPSRALHTLYLIEPTGVAGHRGLAPFSTACARRCCFQQLDCLATCNSSAALAFAVMAAASPSASARGQLRRQATRPPPRLLEPRQHVGARAGDHHSGRLRDLLSPHGGSHLTRAGPRRPGEIRHHLSTATSPPSSSPATASTSAISRKHGNSRQPRTLPRHSDTGMANGLGRRPHQQVREPPTSPARRSAGSGCHGRRSTIPSFPPRSAAPRACPRRRFNYAP